MRRGLTLHRASRPPSDFFAFSSATLAFPLHPWQRLYCNLLERLRSETGIRLLVHGPPQFGKTILTSQRLPAYLLGCDPLRRVGVACYNETHSTNQTEVVRNLMASDEYRGWYPNAAISKDLSAGEFSTPGRSALNDGQPSVKALGLLSGFTGRGVDDLLIDDPYASAEQASSPAINGKVIRWWKQTASPRIKPETNVVVMFHRYHDSDIAAELEQEGGWERYRFPAIADGDESAGIDLTLVHGLRKLGESLSPMRTIENLLQLQAGDAQTFASQFQGKPIAESGGMFRVSALTRCTRAGLEIVAQCRAWDVASTSGGGDYTAGVLVALLKSGGYALLDAVLLQGSPDAVDNTIMATAQEDGRGVHIRITRDPGSAGVRDAQRLSRLLAGYVTTIEAETGAKEVRARPLASQVSAGSVAILDTFGREVKTGPYRGMDSRTALVRMLSGFPNGTAKKDGVDAASNAFASLTKPRTQWGVY